jgi:hypothetical protein
MTKSQHRLIALGIASIAALSASSLTSCRNTTEIEYDTIVVHDTLIVGGDTVLIDTCHTPAVGDLILNGDFDINSSGTHDLGFNEMAGWEPFKGSPQTVPQVDGKTGVIQMWGNGDPTIGEGIAQRLGAAVMAGHEYELSAIYEFFHDNPDNYTPYVRLRFVAFDDRGNQQTIGTLQTSNTSWATETLPVWTPDRSYTSIGIIVENDNTGMNSASWARLDKISLKAK